MPILNDKDLNQCPPRPQRLKIRLSPVFIIRCRTVCTFPEKVLLVADALFCASVENANEEIAEDLESYINAVTLAELPVSDVLFGQIRQATAEGPQLSALLLYVSEGWPSCQRYVRQEAGQFWDGRHMFSCV